MLKNILWIFLVSMVPLIELRGAIILGAGLQVPWWINYIVCVIGNMLPIPFILLFIRAILNWMKTKKRLRGIALWVEKIGAKKNGKVNKYERLGLLLFVAVPLPGTGAWTGALVAALMDMRMKHALPSIFFGVMIAGIFITLGSYGIVSVFSFLGA